MNVIILNCLRILIKTFNSNVHNLNNIIYYQSLMTINQDSFEILRKINNSKLNTQRKLAKELGFSLGKLNYCIKSLKEKGLIKIKNFNKNPNKLNYLYMLTPKGITAKTKLTINYMKKKIKEYEDLKNDLESYGK